MAHLDQVLHLLEMQLLYVKEGLEAHAQSGRGGKVHLRSRRAVILTVSKTT